MRSVLDPAVNFWSRSAVGPLTSSNFRLADKPSKWRGYGKRYTALPTGPRKDPLRERLHAVISPHSLNSFRGESIDSAGYSADGVELLALCRALQIRYDEIPG